MPSALTQAALAAASVGTAPAAPEAAIQQQQVAPTPLHSLTGVAFHVSAVGF